MLQVKLSAICLSHLHSLRFDLYDFFPTSKSKVVLLFFLFLFLFSSLVPAHLSQFLHALCLKDGSVLALGHLCVLFLDYFKAFSII